VTQSASPPPRITLDPSASENGLAVMLSDLIRQNISRNPQRLGDFQKLHASVAIRAADIDVRLTMVFTGNSLAFYDGVRKDAQVAITADSDSILGLSLLSIRFGLPWLFDKSGTAFLKKLIARSLKIKGLLFHPIILIRLTRLVSAR